MDNNHKKLVGSTIYRDDGAHPEKEHKIYRKE